MDMIQLAILIVQLVLVCMKLAEELISFWLKRQKKNEKGAHSKKE
jgi:hypothetical protein